MWVIGVAYFLSPPDPPRKLGRRIFLKITHLAARSPGSGRYTQTLTLNTLGFRLLGMVRNGPPTFRGMGLVFRVRV